MKGENNNSLPRGWVWTKLSEVVETTSGGTPSRAKSAYFGGSIPWLKSGELTDNVLFSSEETITERGLENSNARIFPKGTLLIALYGATVGKLGLLGIEAATNQAICAVFPTAVFEQKFLFWHLLSKRTFLLNARQGGAQPNISQKLIRDLDLPLPPPAEQHRIVAKIEELFSKLDAGIKALNLIKAELKRYRQSVLKHAFEGKLTEEWRKQNADGQTAEKLLEQIKEERRKLLGAKYKDTEPIDTSDLPELPEGWAWARLGSAAEMCLGKMLDKTKNKGKYQRYLRNINVRWGSFDLDSLAQMRFEEDENERYGLLEGDLVVCEGGEPGRAAVWNAAVPNMKIQKALHRVRFLANTIEPKLICYYLQTTAQNGTLAKYFTGTTIKHFTGVRLAEFVFPLIPYQEQTQIVSEIERHFSIADEVEKVVEHSLQQAERLRQSILKRAFEGKLVEQNPSDEPAEKLLERIKAEREKQKTKNKGTKNYDGQ